MDDLELGLTRTLGNMCRQSKGSLFGLVTEKSQSEDSLQVALMLHLERRKQSVGLLLNLVNMKKLQLAVEPHSCWQSSSDWRPKTAPTTFEIGSREQRRSV